MKTSYSEAIFEQIFGKGTLAREVKVRMVNHHVQLDQDTDALSKCILYF